MSGWENTYQQFVANWCETHGRNPPAKNPRAATTNLPPLVKYKLDDSHGSKGIEQSQAKPPDKDDCFKVLKRQPVREDFVTRKKSKATIIERISAKTEIPSVAIEPQGLTKKSCLSLDQSTHSSRTSPEEALSGCPLTFHPTMKQLENFDAYIAHLETQGAHREGIVRIVPPKEWMPRKDGYDLSELNDIVIEKPIKQNISETKVAGAFVTCGNRSLPPLTLPGFVRLANKSTYVPPSDLSYEELEELYWKQNQEKMKPSPVYGADVEASLTDPDLKIFNIPKLHSLLSGMEEKFPGVNLPYLYIGMWRATFSWHTEDMDLYGVNYLHFGAPKTWYCVPPRYGYKLEQLAHKLFPDMAEGCFNLLRHKAVMMDPGILRANNIPFNKLVHEEGTIIVVFPHAYHAGFNHGFNVAEAINFALPRWVEYGKRFRFCVCNDRKREVRINMEQFVEKIQPEKLELWNKGEDFDLHPEDPEYLKLYWEDLKHRLELGFIKKHLFRNLREKLKMKREIDPWFRKRFPITYADDLELVLKDQNMNEVVSRTTGGDGIETVKGVKVKAVN